MEAEDGLRYLEVILRYVVSTLDMSDEEIKSVVEASVSEKKGEFIITTLERWRNEGYHKGLLEAVNLATKLKFPDQHQTIMSLVNKIEDNKKLERIVNVFENFKQASELKKMVEQ